jgi:hypothetical protein
MSTDTPLNRRRFFRQGLSELLKPIARAVAPMERAMQQLTDIERAEPPSPTKPTPPAPASNTVPRKSG